MPKKPTEEKPSEEQRPNEDITSRLLHALNHPIRLDILEHLMRQNASATMLSEALSLKLSNVSYHLCKVLYEECQVVTVVQENQRRGVMEKVFRIKREAYVDSIEWRRIPEPIRSGARGLALDSFVGLAIGALQAEAEEARDDSVFAWRDIDVDEKGHREVLTALKQLGKRLSAIEDRSAARGGKRRRLVVGHAAFQPARIPLTTYSYKHEN